jgi:hypothetical protein
MEHVRGDGISDDGIGGERPGTAQDCAGAFEVLRFALTEVVDGKKSYAELRAPVRQLCVFAHSEDVSAEHLLVRFKEIWASLPPLAGLPRGRQRNDLMARVATMCIEEFYGPPTGGQKQTTT